VSYVALGGVFTANMTGNTVLLGIALARGDGAAAGRSGVALAGFGAGSLAGAASDTLAAVLLEAGMLGAAAWLAASSGPHIAPIACAAAAMGLQASALDSRNPRSFNVTYITGTINRFWGSVLDAMRRGAMPATLPAAVWVTYAAGGASGALFSRAFGSASLLAPIAVLAGWLAWTRAAAGQV
jgi:uncharacterized membrane protein YoaK (UPF0700 family)